MDPLNYFNYFTEIEERFQQARGTGLFLLSPLDWALIESWKESGVPLEAALAGIDRAFDKWHKRTRKFKMVNSLAYCSQEVMDAAREMAEGGATERREPESSGFETERLAEYFRSNARQVREAAERSGAAEFFEKTADSLESLAESAEAGTLDDLEAVEQRLTVLEERMVAAAMQAMSEDEMVLIRQEMTRQLAPHRRKMDAGQIALLEKQYLQRESLEKAGLPRLSLFYLR